MTAPTTSRSRRHELIRIGTVACHALLQYSRKGENRLRRFWARAVGRNARKSPGDFPLVGRIGEPCLAMKICRSGDGSLPCKADSLRRGRHAAPIPCFTACKRKSDLRRGAVFPEFPQIPRGPGFDSRRPASANEKNRPLDVFFGCYGGGGDYRITSANPHCLGVSAFLKTAMPPWMPPGDRRQFVGLEGDTRYRIFYRNAPANAAVPIQGCPQSRVGINAPGNEQISLLSALVARMSFGRTAAEPR